MKYLLLFFLLLSLAGCGTHDDDVPVYNTNAQGTTTLQWGGKGTPIPCHDEKVQRERIIGWAGKVPIFLPYQTTELVCN